MFVYCPGSAKDKATVSIFYLEVEDNLQVIFIESVDLTLLLPEEARLRIARVNTFDLVGHCFFVSFKGAFGFGDSVGVWRYEREGYFKFMKLAELPLEWLFNSPKSLVCRRHFISKSFYNPPAGIYLKCCALRPVIIIWFWSILHRLKSKPFKLSSYLEEPKEQRLLRLRCMG